MCLLSRTSGLWLKIGINAFTRSGVYIRGCMGAKTRINYVSGEKWAYLWWAYMRSGTCVMGICGHIRKGLICRWRNTVLLISKWHQSKWDLTRRPINLFRNMRWKGIRCQISQARNKLIKDKLYCSFLIKISRSVYQFMALFWFVFQALVKPSNWTVCSFVQILRHR